jgi:RNase P/RNase MRP subunit POP5
VKNRTPAERDSQRYLKFRIHSEEKVSFREVLQAVKNSTREFMGIKELSEAQPWLIKNRFNEEEQEGVVKIKREFEDDLRASLTLSELPENGFFEVVKVSGSVGSV